MQNCEEVSMDAVVEDLPTLLERFSTLQNLYQLQQNLADENERLVLKGALDNVVTQLVQSNVKLRAFNKTVEDLSSASALNFKKQQQDGMLENQVTSTNPKLRSNCGKIKKFKTAAAEVMTELDVIRRFEAAGHMKNRVRALYSASTTGSQTQTTNYSGSYNADGSPTPRSSTTYSSSPEEDYPVRRSSRYIRKRPTQKETDYFRRFMNKIAGMFHHDCRVDSDCTTTPAPSTTVVLAPTKKDCFFLQRPKELTEI
ncbi:hypothetical protein MKW92_049897 [Papaver armeniacum]|nr:hypothetical protein MKW92_049897 [Papaver armeniacum]